MARLDLGDIQGFVLSGYGHLPHSAYLFLRFADPQSARAWLAGLVPLVTTADWGRDAAGAVVKPRTAVNVAVTAPGLTALGLPRTVLDTFAQEFVEGMAEEPRPRRMGDVAGSGPDRWEFGGSAAPAAADIHALLIVQAPDAESLTALCADHEARFTAAGITEVVHPRHTAVQEPGGREHFGFRDAISQPEIEGAPGAGTGRDVVKAGEFVLGYENEYGVLPQGPAVTDAADPGNVLEPYRHGAPGARGRDLGRNGTYLVFRKLAQDVAGFRRFLRDNGAGDAALLGAKMMGRWPGGAPLALSDTDDPALARVNDFGYAAEDPRGFRCPVGAHVRRSNPRDHLVGSPEESREVVSRHRILRRGAVYGSRLPDGRYDDDGQPRGLLFLCVNANIARQFEFVQQTWTASPKFGGLYDGKDPVIGPNLEPDGGNPGPCTMTIPAPDGRRRVTGVPRFVHVRGGGYFFLPSVRAMKYLASAG